MSSKPTRSELEYSEQWCRSKIAELEAELGEKPLRSEADALLIESMDREVTKLKAVVDAAKVVVAQKVNVSSGYDLYAQVNVMSLAELGQAIEEI